MEHFKILILPTAAVIALLTAVYLLLEAYERSGNLKRRGKRLKKAGPGILDKIVEELLKIKPIGRVLREISYKLSYFNSCSTRTNYRNAFLLSILCIPVCIILYFLLLVNFGSVWYLSLLYVAVIILLVYIGAGMYSDFKENAISRQLPEALNDLKTAYDSKRRLKPAIAEACMDMPREIGREFTRLAESDNLEEALLFLMGRVKNRWLGIVLSIMLLAVRKGDSEGALSSQLGSLNASISQEILLRESGRMLFQLYKLFVLAIPFIAIMLKNLNMEISPEIAGYYLSIDGMNAFALFLVICIGGYFALHVLERI